MLGHALILIMALGLPWDTALPKTSGIAKGVSWSVLPGFVYTGL